MGIQRRGVVPIVLVSIAGLACSSCCCKPKAQQQSCNVDWDATRTIEDHVRRLDDVKRHLEEWGTMTMGAPLVSSDSKPFAFDPKVSAEDLFKSDRLEGSLRVAESSSVRGSLSVKADPKLAEGEKRVEAEGIIGGSTAASDVKEGSTAPIAQFTGNIGSSPRSKIRQAAGDNFELALHKFLSSPESKTLDDDYRVQYMVMNVACRPGWRTENGFVGKLEAQLEYDYGDAKIETHGHTRFPRVIAVYPQIESQVLDLRSSARELRAFGLQLAAASNIVGGKLFIDAADRLERDAQTRSDFTVSTSFVNGGRSFGFTFVPKFTAQNTDSPKKAESVELQQAISFPIVAIVAVHRRDYADAIWSASVNGTAALLSTVAADLKNSKDFTQIVASEASKQSLTPAVLNTDIANRVTDAFTKANPDPDKIKSLAGMSALSIMDIKAFAQRVQPFAHERERVHAAVIEQLGETWDVAPVPRDGGAGNDQGNNPKESNGGAKSNPSVDNSANGQTTGGSTEATKDEPKKPPTFSDAEIRILIESLDVASALRCAAGSRERCIVNIVNQINKSPHRQLIRRVGNNDVLLEVASPLDLAMKIVKRLEDRYNELHGIGLKMNITRSWSPVREGQSNSRFWPERESEQELYALATWVEAIDRDIHEIDACNPIREDSALHSLHKRVQSIRADLFNNDATIRLPSGTFTAPPPSPASVTGVSPAAGVIGENSVFLIQGANLAGAKVAVIDAATGAEVAKSKAEVVMESASKGTIAVIVKTTAQATGMFTFRVTSGETKVFSPPIRFMPQSKERPVAVTIQRDAAGRILSVTAPSEFGFADAGKKDESYAVREFFVNLLEKLREEEEEDDAKAKADVELKVKAEQQ